MKKTWMAVALMLLLAATLACAGKPVEGKTEPTVAPAEETVATEAPATEVPATEAPATEVPATEVPATEVPAMEVPATEVPATEAPATAAPVVMEGSIVNFDDMCFYINGTKFTLGVTTLQDMIDAGVPFKAADLENAENNVKANYQEQFSIELGEYWSAIVYVLNDTEEGKKASTCYINEVYFPNKTDRTQDVLRFDFPFTITLDELLANVGREPDENRHYDGENGYYTDTVSYTKSSTKYFNKNRYRFEFAKGVLSYFTMTYMP